MAGRSPLVGIGLGLAAAGAAAAAGIVAERATRGGELNRWSEPGGYEHVADRETVTVSDGLPLHVEIDDPQGEAVPGAPTVVLAHGYTLTQQSWVLQRRALTRAGFRVVLWDQRSHGRSERADPETCTIDQLARDLHAVINDHAPEGPLVLIGHSVGGMTIMAWGEQHPDVLHDRVQAVAFVGTSAGGTNLVALGFGPTVGTLLGRFGPGVLHRIGRSQPRFDALRKVGRGIEDVLVDRFSFDSPMSKEAVRFAGGLIMATPLSVMGDFLPTLEKMDKRDALQHFVGIETLVINGVGDLLTPPDHSAEIVRRIPGAEHVVIEDAGHLVMLEHPAVVTEQLLELIQRGMRDAEIGVHVERKPRVRRVLKDLTRARTKSAAARGGQRGRNASKAG